MKQFIFALTAIIFTANVYAQSPASPSVNNKTVSQAASDCEARAVSKNGKPLAGAARTSFIKKCEGGDSSAKTSSCAAKAIDKNGKPLAGAAKTSFMKKCETDSNK